MTFVQLDRHFVPWGDSDTPGRATFAALHRFAELDGFPVQVEHLQNLALKRAKEDSEHAPWPASEAYALEGRFDVAPTTPGDLQEVAMRRLSDVRHGLHHDDFAQGRTVKGLPDEPEVQKWVAAELRERQDRAYSVEREPHIADEKEPDIRLRAKASDASLPIEIKIAESWPLSQLEVALDDQLGGRYLRAQDAKHGILLLVHQHARPRGWRDASGRFLSFGEVVDHLQRLASETASQAHDAAKAVVAAIDVSDIAPGDS